MTLLAALAGCSSQATTGPALSAGRQVDRVRVTLSAAAAERGADGVARFTFQVANQGDAPVSLVQCGDRFYRALDRWDNTRWVEVGFDVCLAIHPLVPVPLAPGAARSEPLGLSEPGRYRLRLGVTAAPTDTVRWTLASETFEVR